MGTTCYRVDGRSNIARVQRRRTYASAVPCPTGSVPLYASATVSGTSLAITFGASVTSNALDGVKVQNGGTANVESVAGSPGVTLTYTISPAVVADDEVSISYDGQGSIVATDDGAFVPSFAAIITAT